MEQILTILNAGGDIGVWVLLALAYRFDRSLLEVKLAVQSHVEKDDDEHDRTNARLKFIEDKVL